jgi:hypothetical protein
VFPVGGLVYPVKDQPVLVGDAACRTGGDEPDGMEAQPADTARCTTIAVPRRGKQAP